MYYYRGDMAECVSLFRPTCYVHSQIDLSYDSMGRLLSEKTTSPTGSYQLQHQYDGLGNRLSTELPTGKTLNWLYYGSGHLHQINLDGEVVSDYERDALYLEEVKGQALQNTFSC